VALDVRTMYVYVALTCFIVAATLPTVLAGRSRREGAPKWVVGWALQGMAWVFLGLRGIIGDFFSIVTFNALLTVSYSLLYGSIREHQDCSYDRRLLVLPPVLTVVFIFYFSAVSDNLAYRSLFISGLSFLQCALLVWALVFTAPGFQRRSSAIAGFAFFASSLIYLVRFLEVLLSTPDRLSLFEPGILQTIRLIAGFAVVVIANIGFLLMAQQKAELHLQESERHYRSLFDNMLNGYMYCKMLFDGGTPSDFIFLETNGAFERLTGLGTVKGKKASEVLPGFLKTDLGLFQAVSRVTITGEARHFEIYVEAIKSWLAVSLYSPRRGHFVSIFDVITERRQAEEALKHSLEEKEVLLKEVHHRVKNNLQVVASLLSLQATNSGDPRVVEVLGQMGDRVRSIALSHEMLYRSDDLSRVDLSSYVDDIGKQLMRSYGPKAARVTVVNTAGPVAFPLEQAVPCGLIVNELVSNALKHGFPDQRPGTVTVELSSPETGRLALCVRDDGMGLPPDFDIATSSSLGLRLVTALVLQIDGVLTVQHDNEQGAVFCIDFPALGSVSSANGHP
jgi:two-component sensor histidine kinase/PAS domain-containing protein